MEIGKKVTGYRGINQEDNTNLNGFISGILKEFRKLPKLIMNEYPVIQQMAEHRAENLRLINGFPKLKDKYLKLVQSAWREGFIAGIERVRLIRSEELKKIRIILSKLSKGFDVPEKLG